MRPDSHHRDGFTLVEMLAALAISSMIFLSMGVLIHQNVFFFDHGTRSIDQSEQLALLIDSLRRDFGGVRFAVQKNANGVEAAFRGTAGGDANGSRILFVTAGGRASGPQGEEVVSITTESGEGFTQIVRRRAAWSGPRMHLEDAHLGDPVILYKGAFRISFAFSELTEADNLIWHGGWNGRGGLPHSVRLSLRDSEGAELAGGAVFPIHADAPPACATGEKDCLSLAPEQPPAAPGAQPAGNSPQASATR